MSLKESSWSREEDNLIRKFVIEKKIMKWKFIANILYQTFNRELKSGKQCRERWHDYLDPNIKKDDWSKEEKILIFKLQRKFGNKWSKISKYLPGRTDNSIKNCFYSVIRKNIRKYNKGKADCEKLKGTIKTLLHDPEKKEILFNPSLNRKINISEQSLISEFSTPLSIIYPEVQVPILNPYADSKTQSAYLLYYNQDFTFTSSKLGFNDFTQYPFNHLVNYDYYLYEENLSVCTSEFMKYPINWYLS
ncbi:hypothetical protein SteCoe_21591 [Stentor coeruleus]|uniref:Myb-like DNA-binding domain containing protein n=1 Tax=Stentor coeruleus TaxID=5963 RepID=A0A1R2BPA1_9CILI|nr:hypothetical protein SteCoe_21591 [Stentor coeruleus]